MPNEVARRSSTRLAPPSAEPGSRARSMLQRAEVQVMEQPVEPVTIPREVFYISAIAPWIITPLMQPMLYSLELEPMLRKIAAVYVPFLATPALLSLAFAYLAPKVLRWRSGRFARFLTYFTLASVSSVVASRLTFETSQWILGARMNSFHHVLQGLIITWAFSLPTVLVQEHRSRAAQLEERARREREAALEAQLQALQARTQPHFFFNSINTVASLIPEDPQRAEETLIRLAEILRYALEGGRTRFVSLDRELAVARDYLEVQKARFEAKLRFRIDEPHELAVIAVPPLFLQPLVENAVLHGVSRRTRGGEIHVSVTRDRDCARIGVVDDGVGPGHSDHRGTGTALRDLAARLELLYGGDAKLESGPAPGGGYRVEVLLPARELSS